MTGFQQPIFEITLADLKFHAYHGVLPQETKVGNEFSVTVTVRIPYSSDILNDDLNATISYAEIYEIVDKEMKSPKKLLETVAASIRQKIISQWAYILSGEITISKSTPPINRIIGDAKIRLIF